MAMLLVKMQYQNVAKWQSQGKLWDFPKVHCVMQLSLTCEAFSFMAFVHTYTYI